MKPIKGHAFTRYEQARIWRKGLGWLWGEGIALCECGAEEDGGVLNISSARQWHREHKSAILAASTTGSDQ